MNVADRGRRDFLAAGAALAIAPGVFLYAGAQAKDAAQPASGKVRWGLLVDTTRCSADCRACVDACNRENALGAKPSRTSVQWLRKVSLTDRKTGAAVSAPLMCQHCASAPCVDVCPTGASFRRADGIVLVDRHRCIGCRYCMMACPYKARSFVHDPNPERNADVPRGKGCVEGCTLCVHRIDRGAAPACVEACAAEGHGAIVFGDLDDAQSEISRRIRAVRSTALRADLRLDPAVRYTGL